MRLLLPGPPQVADASQAPFTTAALGFDCGGQFQWRSACFCAASSTDRTLCIVCHSLIRSHPAQRDCLPVHAHGQPRRAENLAAPSGEGRHWTGLGAFSLLLNHHGKTELLLITVAFSIMCPYIGFSSFLVSISLLPHSPVITSQKQQQQQQQQKPQLGSDPCHRLSYQGNLN